MKKHQASFKVLGKSWRLFIVPLSDYEKRFDKTSVGITLSTKKEIFISDDQVHLEVILHEIAHAFFDEICAHAAELDGQQMEEIACDLIAKHSAEITKIASRVFRQAKKRIITKPNSAN